jgi:hypothetical protein
MNVATPRFITCALLFLSYKLWLMADVRTIPVFAPHDETNFIEHAKAIADGTWFGTYNVYTLIKQPFFPMYLATLSKLSLDLTTAHILLDAVTATIACLALSPLLRRTWANVTLWAIVFFSPVSYDALSWMSMRSQVAPDLAVISVACVLALYLRRREALVQLAPWSLGLGFSFGAFWLTREEAIWLVPAILMVLAFAIRRNLRNSRHGSGRGVRLVISIAASAGVFCGCIVSIMALNGRFYGWPVTSENTSPEFVSAYNSLTRIAVPKNKYDQIPTTARRLAYRVSPAASKLRVGFEEESGLSWHNMAPAPCDGVSDLEACRTHDVGGSFIIWSFRDAVSDAGEYISGTDARRFYLSLAAQIDAACAARSIPCRSKGNTVFPAVSLSDVPEVAAHLNTAWWTVVTLSTLSFDPLRIGSPIPSIVEDYRSVVTDVDETPAGEPIGNPARDRARRELGKAYRSLFPALIGLAGGFGLLRTVRMFRRRWMPPNGDEIVLLCAVGTSVMFLLVILATLDAISFPTFNAEYLGQSVTILLFASSATLLVELPIAMRFLRLRLPLAVREGPRDD